MKGVYIPETQAFDPGDFCMTSFYKKYVSKILIPHGLIKERVKKMAESIFLHYSKLDGEFIILTTMNGAFAFFATLSESLIDYSTAKQCLRRPPYFVEFLKCSSYFGTEQASDVNFSSDVTRVLNACKKKHVLIVEDLIDSGHTLTKLRENLETNKTLSVKTACCFSKRTTKWNGFTPDWVGFDVDDHFIVGYGCDLNEYFRDLPHICIFKADKINELLEGKPQE
uniref:Hypoxanthine-guanine-xanthine phosphoribosyltransferase-like n=1 Tax=Dermatophagoides pteronyssinus TaxID=6956 RepID=A0A6P6Y9P1_DERPT|nr:hypoxanthine-guanine-xanthine phosphoribosyltransferase-like [Dermatophagoides pteronyssinus]